MGFKKLCVVFILIFIISCNKEQKYSLFEKEDKFTLNIGHMENEIDFFSRNGLSFSLITDIYMKDGIFYISNGNGKKILKFNSYGDLLNTIKPSIFYASIGLNDTSWSFNEPGNMAISSKDFVYIDDSLEYDYSLIEDYIDKSYDLSPNKTEIDKHILTEKIISVFDNEGNYLYFIGQDGIGGKPFPYIFNIVIDKLDRLIVICQSTYFWQIFRYDSNGNFIDKTQIDLANLPSLESNKESITQIDGIIADRNKDRLLFELTFFSRQMDDKTNQVLSMKTLSTRVYYYDLGTNTFISWMETPNSITEERLDNFYLLDIAMGKYLFFMSNNYENQTKELKITNENGYVIGHYDLGVDNSNLIYSNYSLSMDGILTSLLCSEYAGAISWWRTDKILIEDGK
jgi:hypothetical protein